MNCIYRGGSRIPRRRGRQPLGDANIQICQIFPNEIKNILVHSGRMPGMPPLDLPPIYLLVPESNIFYVHANRPSQQSFPIFYFRSKLPLRHLVKIAAKCLLIYGSDSSNAIQMQVRFVGWCVMGARCAYGHVTLLACVPDDL